MDRYAVFGFPISHSMSPSIHQRFAEQTGEQISYEAIEVRPEDFDETVDSFFKGDGKGLNCTVPLKELAFKKADTLTERASLTGAVNTLKLMEDGSLLGDNTDGIGLITDLCNNLGLSLEGRRVLVLGAGGATRGILEPLLRAKPSALWLANRTVSKAQDMEAVFAEIGPIHASSYAALAGEEFDLIINATSTSLTGDLPPLANSLLSPKGVCYDLAYSKEPTAFVVWGEKQGAVLSMDGLGMLVEQAAHAFDLWRGVMPDTSAVRAGLRA
jgi:shikimate dehydrogenase